MKGTIMKKQLNWEKVEKNVYKAIYSDGLESIFAGVGLAFMALFFFDHRHAWAVSWGFLSYTMFTYWIRKKITYPRTG